VRVQGAEELNETHTLDATLAVQVQANLSAQVKAEFKVGSGFEEPEWDLDMGFQYDLL